MFPLDEFRQRATSSIQGIVLIIILLIKLIIGGCPAVFLSIIRLSLPFSAHSPCSFFSPWTLHSWINRDGLLRVMDIETLVYCSYHGPLNVCTRLCLSPSLLVPLERCFVRYITTWGR